ncbi:hypothetical protein EJB05_52440 [Eragrostis curvula]|uniref:Uncharacterized protein n=1 Tax=Eragrostis curvula TaxID=38414 RepID=A0A5J9ST32_9POAL|nr:hypothetical protein EJB05_52440 [Eragrostis curvula]
MNQSFLMNGIWTLPEASVTEKPNIEVQEGNMPNAAECSPIKVSRHTLKYSTFVQMKEMSALAILEPSLCYIALVASPTKAQE